jgi:IS5 family transposase
VPDHSSLSRTRDRFGEAIFETVFREIVFLCQKKGLVGKECRVMTDATLIAADASLNSLIHNDPEEAAKEAVTQERDHGLKDATSARHVSNRTHTSRTDPDATLAEKRGTPRQLKYKVHQTIDADSRVILDTHVTTGARHDNQPYLQQIQRVQHRYKLTIDEAIADRGYGSAEIIRALKERGTKPYIPLWNRRSGRNSGTAVGLQYERENDRIRCAAGKYLYPSAGDYWNRKRYSTSAGACRDCALDSTCAAKNRAKAPHTRFVLRPNDQDLFDEVQAQMNEPEFRKRASERMWKCEGLFAEAKQYHGLARAKYRGRSKVQIQAYLTAMVQNLKRLVIALYLWLVARSLLDPFRSNQAPASRNQARLFQHARSFFDVSHASRVFETNQRGNRAKPFS